MKRTLAALALAVISATTITGTAHATAPTQTNPASASLSKKPAIAVMRLMTAIEDGDGRTACSLLTKKYAAETLAVFVEIEMVEPGSTCPEMIETVSEAIVATGGYGPIKTKTVSVKGSKAKVRMTATQMDVNDVYSLVLVNGKWLITGDKNA